MDKSRYLRVRFPGLVPGDAWMLLAFARVTPLLPTLLAVDGIITSTSAFLTILGRDIAKTGVVSRLP
ncbi:MAG: hypothetical protein LBP56_01865 [Odoribacteraceae bacterium]|nr:hypothetical protein [Odoribacteraceae bacterium]